MIICFKCPAEAKKVLDELVGSGQYEDFADVIVAALVNLGTLSRQFGERRSVVISPELETRGRGAKQRDDVAKDPGGGASEPGGTRSGSSGTSVEKAGLQPLFQRAGLEGVSEPMALLPTDVFFPGQSVPLDRWIFGQFSKLLPVKASCRALGHLTLANPGLELEEAAAQIAAQASDSLLFLMDYDTEHGLTRDEAVAIGFPVPSSLGERSRLRYANQFVGSITRQSQLSGLPADLKLIGRKQERNHRVLLTSVGWEFAALPNPVLDSPQLAAEGKFSLQETNLLLDHIAKSVPVEDFAYRTILAAITSGRATPDALDDVCRNHIPKNRSKELSDAFVTTQRSGVVSRMVDLGLIQRRRDGVRVSYRLTAVGAEYAKRPVAA